MRQMLGKLADRKDLTHDEARAAMKQIMSGESTPAQTSAFLTALRMKGETIGEIAALAQEMRSHAKAIRPSKEPLVDTCGTGGDSRGTFNISTTAALIAAGAGVIIAKHGNRSVSSRCGSADVLEKLDVPLLQPEEVQRCIDEIGIGFMFAPYFHPAMRNAKGVREELGFRTVFNILGPLTNPAGASAQVIGVFRPGLTETMAEVLLVLGTKRAMVVHSEGMDEIGLGNTKISEVRDGKVETRFMDAAELGFDRNDAPKVNSKEESAEITLDVLSKKPGPARDISLLNAAAAIYVAGIVDSIADGIDCACGSIDSGAAMGKLDDLRNFMP